MVGRRSRAIFWLNIGVGVAGAVYVVVRSPTSAGVAVAVITLVFFGGLGFLGLHRMRRVRQPSYLELSRDGATLVAPGVLAEPFVIPSRALASATIQAPREIIRTSWSSPQFAAPVVIVSPSAGASNLTVLLKEVLPFPYLRRGGVRTVSRLKGFRAWRDAGYPVVGVRLRLADPATAAPLLQARVPVADKPALAAPGVTPPGMFSAADITRQRRIASVVVIAVTLLLLLPSAQFRNVGTLVGTLLSLAAVAWAYSAAFRASLALKHPEIAIIALVFALLIAIGFLGRPQLRWLLFGTVADAVLGTVLNVYEVTARTSGLGTDRQD
jgi:FtsH-binding integral membrane protein